MDSLKLARPIVPQTQPTPITCTATCVAMALGIPIADLGVRLDQAFGVDDFGVWLAERGIWLRPCAWNGRYGEHMRSGTVYLVKVRSRNTLGVDHLLLLDTRDGDTSSSDEDRWVTYDPNRGRDGKLLYEWVNHYYAIAFWELKERNGRLGIEPPPEA